MSEFEIFRKVRIILAECLRLDRDEITLDCDISADLGADEIEVVEIVLALEEEFEIDISEVEFMKLETVQDVVTWLAENL